MAHSGRESRGAFGAARCAQLCDAEPGSLCGSALLALQVSLCLNEGIVACLHSGAFRGSYLSCAMATEGVYRAE